MEKDTWKDIFCRQVSTGKYWKNLFNDEFEKHQFLDRSDVVYICKKAQSEVYEDIIKKLEGKIDVTIMNELKKLLGEHWVKDDSALGMIRGGKK
jgi:hypothetical protein